MIAAIIGWVASQFVKKGFQVFFILSQFAILVVVTASIFATIAAAFYAYTWSYNHLVTLLTTLQNVNGDSMLSCAMTGLECTGIKSAYENGINLLWVGMSYKLAFVFKRFTLHSLTVFSNEMSKLAYLVGQW